MVCMVALFMRFCDEAVDVSSDTSVSSSMTPVVADGSVVVSNRRRRLTLPDDDEDNVCSSTSKRCCINALSISKPSALYPLCKMALVSMLTQASYSGKNTSLVLA